MAENHKASEGNKKKLINHNHGRFYNLYSLNFATAELIERVFYCIYSCSSLDV